MISSSAELAADARRVMEVLPTRCNRFNLAIHPEKTGPIPFKPPPCQEQSATGQGNATCSDCPLLGQDEPWRLGDQAQDGKEASAPVYESDRGMVS